MAKEILVKVEDARKQIKKGTKLKNGYKDYKVLDSYIHEFEIGTEDHYLGDGIYGGHYKIKTYKLEIEVDENELEMGDWNIVKKG